MKKEQGMDKFTTFKRRLYLVVFPILFLTNASYWVFSPYVDRFMKVFLPFFCLFLAVFWVLVYYKRWIRICELIGLFVFGYYHLFRVHTMAGDLEDGIVNVYLFWSVIYYIYIFLVLERKRAFVFAMLIFMATILIGVLHFGPTRVNDALIQYFLSTFVYILILFYFNRIISSFIESDILRRNAYYDALTDIANRRLIDIWLDNEVNRCRNSGSVFSVIYFDIDYFKEINDEYGHDIGDHVLKEFTTVIKNHLQPNDLFGRWGGEEFILVLKNKTLDEAKQQAENLRKIIENHTFSYVHRLTSSFGVATYQPEDTPKTIVKRADQALYMAKNKGRNTVQSVKP